MTKGALWRKAILRKMAYVSGESGSNLAIIAVGFANIQISWQMGSQKESSDFDENGESRKNCYRVDQTDLTTLQETLLVLNGNSNNNMYLLTKR